MITKEHVLCAGDRALNNYSTNTNYSLINQVHYLEMVATTSKGAVRWIIAYILSFLEKQQSGAKFKCNRQVFTYSANVGIIS